MRTHNIVTDMIVEIPLNSYVKYEFDKEMKMVRCDRILSTPMAYPGNYGYINFTLSEDGDPIDCLIVCDYPLYPNTLIEIKIIGVLLMEDESGQDEKLIVVPSKKVDPSYEHINECSDLPEQKINKIIHFFKHYKDTDKNKWVKIDKLQNREIASKIYKESIERYNN